MLSEKLAEEDGGVAAIAAELDKVALGGECLLGEAKDFGGFFPGDLVVHAAYAVSLICF